MGKYKVSSSGWQLLTVIIIISYAVMELGQSSTISYAHILVGKVQSSTNPKDNIKIQFSYSPEKPIIDTYTTLTFSVQELNSDEHVKDFTARVVVTNGQRLFKFENITVLDGDFSVKYLFPDDGTHQVLLKVTSKDTIDVASFNVFVPHQSPPSLNNFNNLIIGIGIIAAVGVIVIIMLKRR